MIDRRDELPEIERRADVAAIVFAIQREQLRGTASDGDARVRAAELRWLYVLRTIARGDEIDPIAVCIAIEDGLRGARVRAGGRP